MRTLHSLLLAGALALSGTNASARPAQTAASGMVSAADPRAAEAGAEILRKGGNAVDASFATMLALTVVEPQSSGIGGGGYLVYSKAGAEPVTFDGREKAPAAARPDWWLVNGQPMAFSDAQPGGRSVGVPGNIRMMALAHKRYGKLDWAALFQPAIRLARDGFTVTPRFHATLERGRAIGGLTAEARAIYYLPDGSPKPVGATIKNPALARFLEQLARRGPDSFYVGPNAQAVAAAVSGAAHNPAPMTARDLASYEAKPRPPVCGTYRSYRVCGMGPSSSGGFIVLATLKMLERFDLAALGPQSPTAWHLLAEAERLAYADRDKYIGDPDFVRVPLAGLADPAYLAARSALISPTSTMASVVAGVPAGAPATCPPPAQVERGTSHFSVVDRWGNVASETSTIESVFGSGLMVNGYYLNNELTDFSFVPEKDGCPVANRVEGGKRPRSSMAPTIVYGPEGKPVLTVGAAGGSTIPAQVIKAIIGYTDFKMTPQEAIALPTIFAPGDTVFVESGTTLETMIPQLRALGHADVRTQSPMTFKANAVGLVNGSWSGGADPRSEGVAVAQ
ncbi:MAG TPA: gamma-glutamyltransferase [Sphingomicrobium sp.]|jgi:gamma-glutamyltranspeptidase/glutathione hydrolase